MTVVFLGLQFRSGISMDKVELVWIWTSTPYYSIYLVSSSITRNRPGRNTIFPLSLLHRPKNKTKILPPPDSQDESKLYRSLKRSSRGGSLLSHPLRYSQWVNPINHIGTFFACLQCLSYYPSRYLIAESSCTNTIYVKIIPITTPAKYKLDHQ